ncbi:MAG: TFIIB-type zinc ribbon-containing protein, partial [Clostridia bacterium]|nr:TFIIB-type zinc ribbon-containing protein [Clostridia bacterium]
MTPEPTLKCPNCGGGLKFDPEKQKSVCEYCLSTFTNEELAAATQAAEAKAEKAAKAEAAKGAAATAAGSEATTQETEGHLAGYVCDSCGAEVVTEATTSATFCFYCHNPVLITSRLTGEFQPHKIIPFQYDRDKAIATFRQWAKSHRFVPHSFYSVSQVAKMTGLYLP